MGTNVTQVAGSLLDSVQEMYVRIRLRRGAPIQHRVGKNRHVALAAAGLLVPIAVMAFALAAWRLSVDMFQASEFAVREGFFSHWHVWVGVGVASVVLAVRLNRYGRRYASGKLQTTPPEPRFPRP